MKYSRQREIIKNAVLSSNGHSDARQVYELVRREMPNISLGTVYRNLNLLAGAGVLYKLTLPDGNDMFEAGCEAHSHVVCTECGRLFNVELPLFGWIDDMIMQKTGVAVREQYLLARGVCAGCRAKKE